MARAQADALAWTTTYNQIRSSGYAVIAALTDPGPSGVGRSVRSFGVGP
jgi:hypothetical protein